MICDCYTCVRAREWEAALNIQTPEAKEAYEEICVALEDAETSVGWANAVFSGQWPNSVEILEAALEIARKVQAEKLVRA